MKELIEQFGLLTTNMLGGTLGLSLFMGLFVSSSSLLAIMVAKMLTGLM